MEGELHLNVENELRLTTYEAFFLGWSAACNTKVAACL